MHDDGPQVLMPSMIEKSWHCSCDVFQGWSKKKLTKLRLWLNKGGGGLSLENIFILRRNKIL